MFVRVIMKLKTTEREKILRLFPCESCNLCRMKKKGVSCVLNQIYHCDWQKIIWNQNCILKWAWAKYLQFIAWAAARLNFLRTCWVLRGADTLSPRWTVMTHWFCKSQGGVCFQLHLLHGIGSAALAKIPPYEQFQAHHL